MSPEERADLELQIREERVAQGLPERIADPAVLARIAALLVAASSPQREERVTAGATP